MSSNVAAAAQSKSVHWARGSYRTAAHAVLPGRRALCGTHLGYGMLIDAEHSSAHCLRCELALESDPSIIVSDVRR